MCKHLPQCPPAEARDRDAARVIVAHPEQGWSLLCNGVVLFDDNGKLRVMRKPRLACRPAARPGPSIAGRHQDAAHSSPT